MGTWQGLAMFSLLFYTSTFSNVAEQRNKEMVLCSMYWSWRDEYSLHSYSRANRVNFAALPALWYDVYHPVQKQTRRWQIPVHLSKMSLNEWITRFKRIQEFLHVVFLLQCGLSSTGAFPLPHIGHNMLCIIPSSVNQDHGTCLFQQLCCTNCTIRCW